MIGACKACHLVLARCSCVAAAPHSIYSTMLKPAFVFDGRLILDNTKLSAIGFQFYCVGKRV
jgi:hypothetical protein